MDYFSLKSNILAVPYSIWGGKEQDEKNYFYFLDSNIHILNFISEILKASVLL